MSRSRQWKLSYDFLKESRAASRVVEIDWSKQIQHGSRSHMLSPLFIDTNTSPTDRQIPNPPHSYCEISPQIIYETLRSLAGWKQDVYTLHMLDYIIRTYPVNNVESELLSELREKLRIASIVGIVTQTSPEFWTLTCKLQQRKLTPNHVTLFWQAYADTLRPVMKKTTEAVPKESTEGQTNTARRKGMARDMGDDLI